MAHWLVVVPSDRYAAERLFYHDEMDLSAESGGGLAEGDEVVLAAGDPLAAFGLGRVTGRFPDEDYDPDDPDAPERGDTAAEVCVRYTHRMLDAPVPLPGVSAPVGRPSPIEEAEFKELAARVAPEQAVTAPRRSWLVGVDLPIEAGSPAEAVRLFWSYVMQLGPGELPAFVSPAGDELAMQAYVLGDEVSLDPEEEDE